MNLKSLAPLCLNLLLIGPLHAAPLGTAVHYQGQLADGGSPANGSYDLRFILYDQDVAGSQVGMIVSQEDVGITNGIFRAELDFGPNAFSGDARWLEIAVRPGNSTDPHTVLSPRQELKPSPYALFAPSASKVPWNGVTGVPEGLADGVDNDTTYAAGPGLSLDGTTFTVAPGGVDSPQLADRAVSTGKIADNAVTAAKLAADAVGTAKIQDGAVTAPKLAPSAVSTTNLADLAVTTEKVADGAITSAKLASNAVTSAVLAPSAIGSMQLADASVIAAKLAADAVAASNLVAGAVGTTQIADAAVTSAKLAANSINSALIANGAIGTLQLANGAVTRAKLAADAAGAVDVKDHGARADSGESKITQADIDTHPQWLGTYAVGDTWDYVGIQEAIYAAYGGPGQEHGCSGFGNRPLHISGGVYGVNKTLLFRSIFGGIVYGDGRYTTTLRSTTESCIIETDGVSSTRWESFCLQSGWDQHNGLFSLDWDSSRPGGCPNIANTFYDVQFEGGDLGIVIGNRPFSQGDGHLFINCFWQHCNVAGVKTGNQNALSIGFIGGNFQQCFRAGIDVVGGTINVFNTSFQGGLDEQTGYDIMVRYGSTGEHSTVIGVRSESKNFVLSGGGQALQVIGCNQMTTGHPGIFAEGQGLILDGCTSTEGIVRLSGRGYFPCSVRNCNWGRSDWLLDTANDLANNDQNEFLVLENNAAKQGDVGNRADPDKPFGRAISLLQRNVVMGLNLLNSTQGDPTVGDQDGGVDGAVIRSAVRRLPFDTGGKNVVPQGYLIDMVSPQSSMPFGLVHMGSARGQYIFGQQRLYFPIQNINNGGENGTFINMLNVMVDKVAIAVRKGGAGSINVGDNSENVLPNNVHGGATKYFLNQSLATPGYLESPTKGVIYDARSTTLTGSAGGSTVTVANPYVFNVPPGLRRAIGDVVVAGAGLEGGDFYTSVIARSGNQITLAAPIPTGVTNAVVSFPRHGSNEDRVGSQWALWIEWNDIQGVEGFVVVDVSPFLPE